MVRIKSLAAILGATVLIAVVAACGNGAEPTSLTDEAPTPAPTKVGGTTPTDSNPPTTPIVSHDGPVKDYVSLVDNLRAAGATVDPAGTGSADFFAPQGQLLTVNGERVETFEFASAEEADAASEGVSASGSSIRTTMADGTQKASMVTWVAPPHFYKAGKLIVLYVGCDSDVINVLQETMGPQFAGGAGVSQCPDPVPPTTMDYVSLVDNLRAAGASVDPAGHVSQPFFAPQGQVLTVNGEDVQAFDFASAEDADTVAETVSADGSSIGTSNVRWVAPPNFYKAGRLIVLYVGCDSDVIDLLQETMGPQFAGDADLLQCPEQVPTTNKDYISLVDNLRAAGATVDPAGTGSADFFAPQGQLLTVNGERVETFEFASAEEADAAADGVSASGSSISRVDSETEMGVASSILWEKPPHFYKAGKLIALYVGCDSDVINVLNETMGPQFAGGAGVSQCPDPVPPTTMEISQALEAAEGSEVTVSGFLIADRDGNTRLCSVLAESLPPQCGGDRINLLGFDASSVPNSKTPKRPSDIGTVRWTDSQITVTAIKGIGGLAEVRLSTEN